MIGLGKKDEIPFWDYKMVSHLFCVIKEFLGIMRSLGVKEQHREIL